MVSSMNRHTLLDIGTSTITCSVFCGYSVAMCNPFPKAVLVEPARCQDSVLNLLPTACQRSDSPYWFLKADRQNVCDTGMQWITVFCFDQHSSRLAQFMKLVPNCYCYIFSVFAVECYWHGSTSLKMVCVHIWSGLGW